jgi:thioredoxin-like negative regulator of GroEL
MELQVKNLRFVERYDVDDDKEGIVRILGIRSLPTTMLVGDDGKEITRQVGFMDKPKILEWVEELREKYGYEG